MPEPETADLQTRAEALGRNIGQDQRDLARWREEWQAEWLAVEHAHGPTRLVGAMMILFLGLALPLLLIWRVADVGAALALSLIYFFVLSARYRMVGEFNWVGADIHLQRRLHDEGEPDETHEHPRR